MKGWFTRYMPALGWLPQYKRENLQGDISAGLTVAVMLVPQGMAYAMLAGLPPIIGLYASIIPVLVYALFGTSRQLAVGPVAIVSLMTAAAVGPIANGDTATYLSLAVLLALMVGVIQLGMGAAKFGFLVNFLSHPVISGFTSAAALIIGFSQLKHLLGIDLPRSHHVHEILLNAADKLDEANLITVAIGASSIVLLLGLKKWKPMFPGALAVVVLSTLAVWLFDLSGNGVKIVGDVPAGFPAPALPAFDWESISVLLPSAIAISMVGFMESISVAKAMARRNKYEVEPNQELVGLGLANVAGSFFSAYPTTGGFSRTAVNDQAGAKTGLASILTATIISIVILFFTPLFYHLPKAVLAAIIMVAVFGLIDIKEARHLWQVKRTDLAIMGITFVATLAVGIEQGILTGVAASLLWYVVKTTRPHTAVLGKLPGTSIYRNIDRFPEAETTRGIEVLRIDAEFYFGNSSFLKDLIKSHIARAGAPVKAIVIEANSINQLDSSADATLHEIADELRARNIELYFAEVKGPVMDVMKRSGFDRKLGPDHFFLDLPSAVDAARARSHVAPNMKLVAG